jgi:hypothetical protein
MKMAATAIQTTPATVIHPVDDAPTVIAALAALRPIADKVAVLDARKRRLEEILDPYVDTTSTVSEDLVLEAVEALPTVRVECARSTRELRQAQAALATAREVERDRLRLAFHEKKRALVQRLGVALAQAASTSRELATIEEQERTYTGEWNRSGVAWPELSEATPLQGSRLDDWRRACIEAQLPNVP